MIDTIENALNDSLKRLPPPDDVLYVTEVADCLRKAYLARRVGFRAGKKMLQGMKLHEEILAWIAKRLREIGYKVEVEYEVSLALGEAVLVGRADLVVWDRDEIWVAEVKTSDYVFDTHKRQVWIYKLLLDAKHAVVCYMPREDEFKCIEVELGMTLDDVVERALKLYNALKNNAVPEPEETPLCGRCPFKHMCRKNKTLF